MRLNIKLYIATITCNLKTAYLSGLAPDTVFEFKHAIAAEGETGAAVVLQSTFPWTFYKHVKVVWTCIAVKA